MNKKEFDQLSPFRRKLYYFSLPFSPSFWRGVRQAYKSFRAPVKFSKDDLGNVVAHPSIGQASRTLIEAFKSNPLAESFLTWRLTFPEDDGTPEDGAEWQITISKPGSVPVADLAVRYKEALMLAGVPLPEPRRLEVGERYKIIRLAHEKGLDLSLPGDT